MAFLSRAHQFTEIIGHYLNFRGRVLCLLSQVILGKVRRKLKEGE